MHQIIMHTMHSVYCNALNINILSIHALLKQIVPEDIETFLRENMKKGKVRKLQGYFSLPYISEGFGFG